MMPTARLPRFLTLLFAALISLLALAGHAADEPLPAEEAFRASARLIDDKQVEIRFQVADGYYLYRHRFKFAADGISFGEPALPPGKPKKDDAFGDVEIYRGELVFTLPISAGQPPFTLQLTSQGCADIGICYPPQVHSLDVSSGSTVGSLLGRALGRSEAPAASSAPAPAGDEHDESGRIERLLGGGSTLATLASFFGFGLLLAFTPCVFPMIPILSGIIVGHGHAISKGRALALSLLYVLGMAVTYAAAGVAAGLSGTLLAAALQNPWVLGGFALVFVVLAFSMFGFYELQLPTALQSKLSDSANHRQGGSPGGVVAMGALSALIVGPCVAAPLAGALLYIAKSGDAVLGGAALFAMALGMGAPLVVVGVLARSALPKPGPWMEGVRRAFGVMLLGVAVWLVSPVLPSIVPMLAWAGLLIFSAIYLHALDPLPSHAAGWQRFWKGVGVLALIAGAALFIGALAGSRDPLQPLAILRAQAAQAPVAETRFQRVRSVDELDQILKTATRPVMLDFYADWCISCKEMERFTFADPAVARRLEAFQLVQADVTANNDADKALLKRFRLFGPPGIIFFDAAGAERTGLRVVGFQPAEAFAKVLDAALAR
ncbi:thiol:disulfide interchange protein DsbD [Zoogloea ramigera]|uniref:Thiol:disulfide interchange protein DsbD n=1 Tax=Zoogloea ramigera TaxID=350 RepID=A0A4Y4CXP6_ZOORA|nr:protein-disulfide reductase DsbD [Zoogloea ramigera]GEC96264.1 thiol:disulfide interchange protein DsbD [Zoogloea ramigera]